MANLAGKRPLPARPAGEGVRRLAGQTSHPFDRGRESGVTRSPSLRTGQAGLPHPALRLMVLPPRGLTGRHMSLYQTVQSLCRKVRIGPTHRIRPAAPATALVPLPQQAPQTHPDPLVQTVKHLPYAVLEVPEPAPQGPVHVPNHAAQAP